MNATDPRPDLVLIVDDDPAVRLLTRETLALGGFATVEAANGDNGLALFRKRQPDVVLLDVLMPGKDGFTTCAELRQDPAAQHTPVLMMTGLDDVESINHAYEVGATDFVTKPINWPILAHRVRYMLRASRAMAELAHSQHSLAQAHRLAGLSSWEWDIGGDAIRWSKEIYHSLGVPEDIVELTKETFWSLIHPDDRGFVRSCFVSAMKAEKPLNLDYRIVLPSSEIHTIHAQGETEYGADGRAARMRGTIQDITERKRAEEQIRQLAFYDTLTGLPNRILFTEQLSLALEQAQRDAYNVALFFLDLDNFKRINDTLGHKFGDMLLETVARRLAHCLRPEDKLHRSDLQEVHQNVARLGGDEFTVLVNRIRHPEDAAKVAQRILDALAEPLQIETHELFVSASIGIAIFPMDGRDIDTLLKNADTAMYHAKGQGRGRYQFYSGSMNASALERLELESNIRRALERQEFVLHYQPRLDGHSGEIVGNEALVRWQHPLRGLLTPIHFIELAEETGLIVPLGAWVLSEACRQNKAWQRQGLPSVPVSVNISSVQFKQRNLLEVVSQALTDSGLGAHFLELEVTESMLMQDTESTTQIIKTLKDMGIRISIDDFGTGFSSLNYLKRFPVDTLKIDRSFVKGVESDRDNAAIATAIIALARSLQLGVVAEGVETVQERAFLHDRGCQEMQGYLFSRPIPADELAGLWQTGLFSRRFAPA
jgi:diguanylate cyclase (GGDEF)-like protein